MKIGNWENLMNQLIDDETIIRYLVYKKIFTPYEQEEKFEDESIYESVFYNFGIIEEAYSLPDGDILLKIHDLCVEPGDEVYEDYGCHKYYKLTEIEICEYEVDKNLQKMC